MAACLKPLIFLTDGDNIMNNDNEKIINLYSSVMLFKYLRQKKQANSLLQGGPLGLLFWYTCIRAHI
jgi:hypothetical protein